jgi:NADH oxidase (H2O2-forming)
VSEDKKIVIIGCGAGGGTAAQFARKTNRKATISVFEKDKFPHYSKCGLPYVISGEIKKFKDLIEFSKEWFEKQKINLFLNTRVDKIDIKNKTIFAKSKTDEIKENFDKLIFATGAKPSIPPINNIQKNGLLIKGAHVLRTIDDGKHICSHIKNGKKATIIGAGLIGLEMADALWKKGMEVTIIEALPNILENTIDKDMCHSILDEIYKTATLYTDHTVTNVIGEAGRVGKISIKNNSTQEEIKINTDLLIIATGIKSDISLAENIGCEIGTTGNIIVNNKSETSVKNIYAVGDCTEYIDYITKKPVPIGLGSIVVRQGIAAGINSVGGRYILPDGVLQTCTSKFFGIEVAAVGISGDNFIFGKFNGSSLPDYYPGGKPILVKVISDKNGRIIGAQAVGNNAAKRIDIFACAILGGLNIELLKKLETAYAPPIAPTLDVMTIVCDIISMKLARER